MISDADAATNATQLGGVAANQYVVTTDSRLVNARQPTAGSSEHIQNTTSSQPNSNFNISGNGTAGRFLNGRVVNATSQFALRQNRVLSASSTNLPVATFSGSTDSGGIPATIRTMKMERSLSVRV